MAQYTSEEDTPPIFDVTYDEENNPQRDLTDFVVTRGDQKISICDLDDAEPTDGAIVARGRVVNKGRSLKVVTAPLVEWCIEYGASPHLWVRSAAVWYKLQKPARDYVRIHELGRRRYEICSRIYILATSYPPGQSTYATFTALLAGPYGDMQGYSEKDILLERDFILAQVKNLNHPQLNAAPFVRELKDKRPGSRKLTGAASRKSSFAVSPVAQSPSSSGHWCPLPGLDESGEARLVKKAEKALATISKHKNAYPFREPVDPVAHGCLDYFDRIANPMDFGTIKANIERGNHYKTAVDIANDVRLVASNCREYNGPVHEFSIWATELEKKFENIMRDAEKVERASMEKRLNGTSAKKRRASESAGGSSKSSAKNGSKASRKISSSNDVAASPVEKSEDTLQVEEKPCSRTTPEQCAKMAQASSKYCSDECGMIVARKRIDEMVKSDFDVAAFIRTNTTKSFVRTRGI